MKKRFIVSAIGVLLCPALSIAQPIEGFGNNVPFHVAARQVVPTNMMLNIDPSVDANARVSWKGGPDWRRIIEDMATQRNASVDYSGQAVRISSTGNNSVMPASPISIARAPTLNRGGLIVMSQQPPVQVIAPLPISNSPMVNIDSNMPRININQPPAVSPAVSPAASPAVVSNTSTPLKASSGATPIVLRPSLAVDKVTVESSEVNDNTKNNVKETAREKADRLRSERESKNINVRAERESKNINVHAEPTIRNAQPSSRQPMASGSWRAVKGESLDQILGDWADKAGWTLAFNSAVSYELQAGAEFNGEFTEAVSSLVRSIKARPVPIVTFYKGNKAVVVSNNIDGN